LLKFAAFVALLAAALAALFSLRGRQMPGGELSVMEAVDREFTDLVASVLPSVVSIDAISREEGDPRARFLKMLLGVDTGEMPPQVGSGAVVSADGHIVTNLHVVREAASVTVYLNDGRTFPARVIGGDPRTDLALLQIDAGGLVPIQWGDSDAVRVGQGVFAVGNPLGLQETVTRGIISGKGRRASTETANEFFQTDAAVNQGNSGGPLIDLHGEVIGINNLVTSSGQGISFAIPSNTVRRVIESLLSHGKVLRPWFGAVARAMTPSLARQLGIDVSTGALLLATYDGSPAALAGLQAGDVVTDYNGRPLVDHIDLRNRVAETEPGKTVEITALRNGKRLQTKAVIIPESD
jgi:S1-C subfamily serine protease